MPRFEMAEDEVRDENMMVFLVLLLLRSSSASSCDSGLFYAGSPWLVGDGVSQKEVSCLGGVRGYRGGSGHERLMLVRGAKQEPRELAAAVRN